MRTYAKQIEDLGFKISTCKKYAHHTKYGLVYGKTNTEILADINNRLTEVNERLSTKLL